MLLPASAGTFPRRALPSFHGGARRFFTGGCRARVVRVVPVLLAWHTAPVSLCPQQPTHTHWYLRRSEPIAGHLAAHGVAWRRGTDSPPTLPSAGAVPRLPARRRAPRRVRHPASRIRATPKHRPQPNPRKGPCGMHTVTAARYRLVRRHPAGIRASVGGRRWLRATVCDRRVPGVHGAHGRPTGRPAPAGTTPREPRGTRSHPRREHPALHHVRDRARPVRRCAHHVSAVRRHRVPVHPGHRRAECRRRRPV